MATATSSTPTAAKRIRRMKLMISLVPLPISVMAAGGAATPVIQARRERRRDLGAPPKYRRLPTRFSLH
jgi:hypothetical protein